MSRQRRNSLSDRGFQPSIQTVAGLEITPRHAANKDCWEKMKEYDIEPRQVWRLAKRLLYDVVYDPGIEEKNEWVYASSETAEHQERFTQWTKSKRIAPTTRIWVIVTNPAQETKELSWGEFLSRWTEFLADSDLKVADKAFTWVLEYKPQRVARFGRKPDIQQVVPPNGP